MSFVKGKDDNVEIEIDATALEKRLEESMIRRWEGYKKELENWRAERQERRGGKGVVEYLKADRKRQVLESIHNPKIVKEQWTIAIPSATAYEVAAHLRDYVFVTDVVKGKVGETVTIPYVKDTDFTVLATAHAGTLTAATGLVGTLTTTLKESGVYYDLKYGDIEKIDQNLLDELNRVFTHAAVRSEDNELCKLLDAGTTSQFGETQLGSTPGVGDSTVGGTATTTDFDVSYIADAIAQMIAKGKEVHPGDCVLFMNPNAYKSLLHDMASTTATAIAYARSDIIQKGIVEDYLGVRLLVGGKDPHPGYDEVSSSTYRVSYLMRAKRCLALAPKREILIETDRLLTNRQLRIAASHTFGVKALDLTEAVRIYQGNDKW